MNHPKPKLLVVADTYYPKIDGVLRFLEEFIKRARNSFELTLLVPKFKGGRKIEGVRTVSLETSRIIKQATYPAIKLSFSNFRKIKKEVKATELVFAQDSAFLGYLAIKYAKKYSKKAVFYNHQIIWEQFKKTAPFFRRKLLAGFFKGMSLKAINRCDLSIIPYPELREEMVGWGVKTKMLVAKLGIDINRFLPATDKQASKTKLGLPGKTIIGYVGRISGEKNTLVLLDAFKRLDAEKYFLLIVGDGEREIVKQFKKNKSCQVTGFVEKVEDYLQAMDIFVMPSLIETTSLATLEAMSCGLPVIVTKVGYMKEYVVKDHNGMFFPRANPSLLAMKIEKLMGDEELREVLGIRARKTVAYSFSWERSINKIKRILLRVYYSG